MEKVVQLNHRKSKLILCSTDYIDHVLGDMYFYVESYHYNPIDEIYYMDMLAPSLELHLFIIDALKSKKTIKENSRIFKGMYNQQLKNSAVVRVLKKLETYLQQGKDIVLFCDPVDLRFNHLIIVGDYFKQLDYLVDYKFTLASMNTNLNANLHNILVDNVIDYL